MLLNNPLINLTAYDSYYEMSIGDKEAYWGDQARSISWSRPPTKIKSTSYKKGQVSINWFEDGELNVTESCIDRHAKKHPDKTAIIWEGDDPSESKRISYKELSQNVNRLGTR